MSIQNNPTVSAFTFDRKGRVRRTGKGVEIAMHYKGPNTSALKDALVLEHPFGEPHEDFEDSFLNSIDESPLADSPEGMGMVELILNYGPLDSSSSGTLGRMNPGDWTLETDCGTTEQPLEVAPPAYLEVGGQTQATWASLSEDAKLAITGGAHGWLQPQIIATRTDAVDAESTKTITEQEALETVGQLLSRESMTKWGVVYSSTNRWLYTGKRISINGKSKTVTRTAQGVATQWNTDIYIDDAISTPEN